MDAQDVAEHQLAIVLPRGGNDGFGILDIGGDRLFHEHMGAGIERLDGVFGVAVGPRVDGDGVGLRFGERRVEILVQRIALELGRSSLLLIERLMMPTISKPGLR
jgi:hypothetical protein